MEEPKFYEREKKLADAQKVAWEKASALIEQGKKYIYLQKWDKWERFVKANALENPNGREVEVALEVMEALSNGMSFKKADDMIKSKLGVDKFATSKLMHILVGFYKAGPEFYEATRLNRSDPDYVLYIDLCGLKMHEVKEEFFEMPYAELAKKVIPYIDKQKELNLQYSTESNLIESAVAKAHNTWCEIELRDFYRRFKGQVNRGVKTRTALYNACKEGEKQRNVLELDTAWFQAHPGIATETLETFEGFMALYNGGNIKVKRFASEKLTEEEQSKAGKANYDAETQQENLLRPYEELSFDSRQEILSSVKDALEIYKEFARRGIDFARTEDSLSLDDERAIGTLMHVAWMKRHQVNEDNKHMFVEYVKLATEAHQQYLGVFDALCQEIKKDPKYIIRVERDLEKMENPKAQQAEVLSGKLHVSSSNFEQLW